MALRWRKGNQALLCRRRDASKERVASSFAAGLFASESRPAVAAESAGRRCRALEANTDLYCDDRKSPHASYRRRRNLALVRTSSSHDGMSPRVDTAAQWNEVTDPRARTQAPPGSAQKRPRSPSPNRRGPAAAPSSDGPAPTPDAQPVSTPAGSLPGSSPPPATSDFEDEDIYGLADGDLEDVEEEEGEDLFDDDMLK